MADRPLYVITQFWGEAHRDYLLSWCIPSLLASGNLPAIPGRHKFIVACPMADWLDFTKKPIVTKLREIADVIHVPHEGYPPPQDSCRHMGVAHRAMTAMCWQDKALCFPVTPDLLISENTLSSAYTLWRCGASAVLTPAVRFEKEAIFALLNPYRKPNEALSIPGHTLAKEAVTAFHSETLRWEWDSPYVFGTPSAIWTRHGSQGVQIHSLSFAPLLLDYAALPAHDQTVFDKWTMDGDYVYANWGDGPQIGMIDDSDSAMLVSFTPRDQKKKVLAKYHLESEEVEIAKARQLCLAYWSPNFDPLKRRLFLQPVRWHKGQLDARWREAERAFAEKIDQYIETWRVAVEFTRRVRDFKTPPELADGIPAPLREKLALPAAAQATAG